MPARSAAKPPLPRSLAAYIATSALRSSVPGRRPGAGDGDADAGLHQQARDPPATNGQGQAVEDPLGDSTRAAGAHRRAAARRTRRRRGGPPCACGRTQLLERRGHGDQQRVADVVAERVVDGLEVVQVDQQHRDRRGRRGQRGVDPLAEQVAVGQPGQRVVGAWWRSRSSRSRAARTSRALSTKATSWRTTTSAVIVMAPATTTCRRPSAGPRSQHQQRVGGDDRGVRKQAVRPAAPVRSGGTAAAPLAAAGRRRG